MINYHIRWKITSLTRKKCFEVDHFSDSLKQFYETVMWVKINVQYSWSRYIISHFQPNRFVHYRKILMGKIC